MTASGDSVVALARACLGTPFRAQGRLPGVGLDCVGLVVHVARARGLRVDDRADYALTGDHDRLAGALSGAGLAPVAIADITAGDVLLFRLAGVQSHLGIASRTGDGAPALIHAHLGLRRVVEHRLDDDWRAALVAAWRFPVREA
ncbi:NlpC/P60 family protein [Parapedomonas caeni]|jgi:cell wall-associated NlpC family hydrolase